MDINTKGPSSEIGLISNEENLGDYTFTPIYGHFIHQVVKSNSSSNN